MLALIEFVSGPLLVSAATCADSANFSSPPFFIFLNCFPVRFQIHFHLFYRHLYFLIIIGIGLINS